MKKRYNKLLKLSIVEDKILNQLSRAPYSFTISTLSKNIAVARRTVGFNMQSLHSRGLVNVENTSRYPMWSLSIQPTNSSDDVQIIRGVEDIKNIIWKLLKTPGLNRYYTIQGTDSVKEQIKIFDDVFLQSIHGHVKKNKIVIEGVISDSALKKMGEFNLNKLLSHKDRLTVVYIVDDSILNFSYDFYVIADNVCIVDFKNQILTLVKNRSLASGIFSLLRMAEMYGKRIVMNEYIDKLIIKSYSK